MLTTATIYQTIHYFTGIRALMIALMVVTVAVGWQASTVDANEDEAEAFTVGGEENEASGDHSSSLGDQGITVENDFGMYPE